MIRVNRFELFVLPKLPQRWKLFWFLGLFLILGWTYRLTLERIAGNLIFLLADRAVQSQNNEAALWWIQVASRTGIAHSSLYDLEGLIYAQLNREQEMKQAFREATSDNRPSGSALNNAAVTSFQSQQFATAHSQMDAALQELPNNSIIYYNQGIFKVQAGDLHGAEQAFHQARYINDSWALPSIQLSKLYLETKRYAQAEQAAREAISRDPAQLSGHLALIHALHAQSKMARELLTATEAALAYFPEDFSLKFYQALFTRDSGKRLEALQMLRQLKQSTLSPNLQERLAEEIGATLHPGNS